MEENKQTPEEGEELKKEPENNAPENSGDTPQEGYKVGHGKPPLHTRFSKTNQPSNEAKSKGVQEAVKGRALIKQMLHARYLFPKDSAVGKALEKEFGKGAHKKSIIELMTMRQVQKAIAQGNTVAFKELLAQGLGVKLEHVGKDGKELNPERTTAVVQIISVDQNLPDIVENEPPEDGE